MNPILDLKQHRILLTHAGGSVGQVFPLAGGWASR